MKTYLSADEATTELGISRSTLYAYVSRGLIRSEEHDHGRRTRRYQAEDVARLKQRQEQRRDPAKAVGDALNWGLPVIDSAITRIADGSLFYRGHDAVGLAENRTVEETASLIWTGSFDAWNDLAGQTRLALPAEFWTMRAALVRLDPYDALQALLPVAASRDRAAFDQKPESVARTGRRVLSAMLVCLTGAPPSREGVAETLQHYWRPDDPRAADLIRTALILCADHELNASAFTARCIASTGATPYAVVQGGLAALRGFRHGGISERVAQMLADCCEAQDLRTLLTGRLQRGEGVPGFGHVLYPDGDPRGRKLIDMTESMFPKSPETALARRVVDEAWTSLREHPNVDFGLATMASALHLPAGSALLIFALGRTIGWIGHAIEQYQTGRLIRPRARYVGAPPPSPPRSGKGCLSM